MPFKKNNESPGLNRDEKVRFYFNWLTGKIGNTGENNFLPDQNWKYIAPFLKYTKLTATLDMDAMKWVIHIKGEVVFTHSMTDVQVMEYKRYIADEVLKKLTQ